MSIFFNFLFVLERGPRRSEFSDTVHNKMTSDPEEDDDEVSLFSILLSLVTKVGKLRNFVHFILRIGRLRTI